MNMTLEECYQQLGADYPDAIKRLHTEPFAHQCIVKFIQDTNFKKLSTALSGGDCGAAFRAAHTFRSLCHTLSFCHLYSTADALTEELRVGNARQAGPLLERLTPEYRRTLEILCRYQAEAANR